MAPASHNLFPFRDKASSTVLRTLQGRNLLQTLLASPSFTAVHAFARRDFPADLTSNTKLKPIVNAESSQWPTAVPDLPKSIFFSALGTTRAQAGGLAGQRAIDHDLNIALAKQARANGVRTYVLVSVGGASTTSMIPYSKMKGEIEDGIAELGFEHCVILRPGLIVGERREDDSRPTEFALRKLAGWAGCVSDGLKDFWAQDAQVIARAGVAAALKAGEGKGEGKMVKCKDGEGETKVWIIEGKDIVTLGRTEWKE